MRGKVLADLTTDRSYIASQIFRSCHGKLTPIVKVVWETLRLSQASKSSVTFAVPGTTPSGTRTGPWKIDPQQN